MPNVITVNRAPVLTLWAAVVAERLGFTWDEALTLGRAVAGLNAYSKGVRLGLFRPTPEAERERSSKARHGEALPAAPRYDIGRILKDQSWSRSVRPSAIIERVSQ